MIEIYTDGATAKNGSYEATGGSAFVVVKDGEILFRKAWPVRPSTNNICELEAIIKGCEFADETFPFKEVTIYSDSAYCINCYKEKWYKKWEQNSWVNSKKKPVKNKELWEQLIPFFENDNFFFEKVKGHSGNKFNELADEMAVHVRIQGGGWYEDCMH